MTLPPLPLNPPPPGPPQQDWTQPAALIDPSPAEVLAALQAMGPTNSITSMSPEAYYLELGNGLQGLMGPQGSQGALGPQGLAGPQGPMGAQWWIANFAGLVPTTAQLPAAKSGDIALDTSAPSKFYILNGTTWFVQGQLQGVQGPQGIVALDTVATDITMNGVQAAGAIGKASDAGHVHPTDVTRAPLWLANTAYLAGAVVRDPMGWVIVRTAAGTSRGVYDLTEAGAWVEVSGQASVNRFGAKADGATTGTNNAPMIAAAIANSAIVQFGPGQYRSARIEMAAGTWLRGYASGGYGTLVADNLQTHLAPMANVNDHLIHLGQGIAHCRITDLHIDGNKNNNTSGNGVHMDDVATPEECQLRIDRCFIEATAGYGVYVGNGRRAVKIQDSVVNYAGGPAGIRINGSDGLVRNCIVGSNVGDGIQVGANITRITECDLYGNVNGVNVLSTLTQVTIFNNGIDRNLQNGVYLASSTDQIIIAGNNFHSNSQQGNGVGHHINVQTTTGGISVNGNTFGIDSGITFAAGYCVFLNGAGVTAKHDGTNIIDNNNAANSGLCNDYSRFIGPDNNRLLRWAPTGAQAVNLNRLDSPLGDVAGILTSGQLQVAGGMVLPMGMRLTASNKINVLSGNTAGASLTHCWFALIDQNGNVLVQTVDDVSGSWAGNSVKSLALASNLFVAADTPVYVGIMVAGTTLPSFRALNSSNVALGAGGDLPVVAGFTTNTGLTTPASLTTPVGAMTASAANPYCWLT